MTDLPPGWAVARLGEVADWGSGGTPRAGNLRYYGGDVPWAVIGDLNDSIVNRTASSITDDGVANSSAKVVPAGTVLVAMYGSIGKLGIAGRAMATNQAIAHARALPDVVDERFLFWFLRSERRRLTEAGKGAAQQNIGQGILKNWQIAVPPLVEQRRIVAVLEDHFSRIEAADGSLNESQERLDSLRRGLFFSAFAGRPIAERPPEVDTRAVRTDLLLLRASRFPEGGKRGRPVPAPIGGDHGITFPRHWSVTSLEEATDPVRTISYGILKPGENRPDGVPYVRVVNMRGDRIAQADLHRTSQDIDAKYSRSRLRAGDVLLSIRGTYGRVALVPTELEGANITQDTARLAFLDGIDVDFACLYLRSPQAQEYFRNIARGVAVKGINIGDLRTMPFPFPGLEEQREIARRVAEVDQQRSIAAASVAAARRRGSALRAGVLRAAFSGQLVQQNSTDEAASRPLERIRSERHVR